MSGELTVHDAAVHVLVQRAACALNGGPEAPLPPAFAGAEAACRKWPSLDSLWNDVDDREEEEEEEGKSDGKKWQFPWKNWNPNLRPDDTDTCTFEELVSGKERDAALEWLRIRPALERAMAALVLNRSVFAGVPRVVLVKHIIHCLPGPVRLTPFYQSIVVVGQQVHPETGFHRFCDGPIQARDDWDQRIDDFDKNWGMDGFGPYGQWGVPWREEDRLSETVISMNDALQAAVNAWAACAWNLVADGEELDDNHMRQALESWWPIQNDSELLQFALNEGAKAVKRYRKS